MGCFFAISNNKNITKWENSTRNRGGMMYHHQMSLCETMQNTQHSCQLHSRSKRKEDKKRKGMIKKQKCWNVTLFSVIMNEE
mmetsp:Transcript_45609/g.78598  ORF Transcript_45609/g.78598 Transcript_45609/m.78598 type:complete len:82 (+) Transcript_45609:156-401(+)